jgi:quinol monooxygenase YgiN
MDGLFGLHGSFRAQPGRGEELATVLLEAARGLEANEACRLYLVHRSVEDPDTVWVTEAWTDRAAHDASLEDPATRELIARARPLIAGMQGHTELNTLGGKGL